MTRYSLLCTAENDSEVLSTLSETFDVTCKGFALDLLPQSRYSAEEVEAELAGYDVYLCGYDKATDEALSSSPDLKLILSVRDGLEENIDIDACTKLGIPVLACSGRCERSVPEYLVAQLLLMAKPIIRDANTVRAEGWTRENDLALRRLCEGSTELAGKTIGIVGLGRNGRGLAKRLQGFEVNLIAYDPYISPESVVELDISLVDLNELMKRSDYVVLMARVSPETKGMISRELLSLMKDGACLVNAARAALVDYQALYDEVASGRLRAALDVFEAEPLGEGSPWLGISDDRLLITSHLAGLSVERITYQTKYLVNAIERFMRGEMQPSEFRNPAVVDSPTFAARGGALWGALGR